MTLSTTERRPAAPETDQQFLVMVGTHHSTASLEARERMAFEPAYLEEALGHLKRFAREGFVLSTCNRVEIYGVFESYAQGERALRHYLEQCHNMPPDGVTVALATRRGSEAVRHLFRVAAGLDSMVLGEDQIVSQLKSSLQLAQRMGASGRFLRRLGHAALAAGKLVRSSTEIGRSNLSVVSVGLNLARSATPDFRTRRVLVVGGGRMATLILKHLEDAEPSKLVLVNRTWHRAQRLSQAFGVEVAPFERLESEVARADVVITCTAAPNVLLTAGMVARAVEGRESPLLVLDLAVPRNVDPAARQITGVRLMDIDDLQEICEANRAARTAEVAEAEALLDEAVAKFTRWWSSQRVVPTIKALRARAEHIRNQEVRRTLARLNNLSPEEQEAIEALTASIVNKLLHEPIVTIKDPSTGEHLAQAAQQLFQLSVKAEEDHVN